VYSIYSINGISLGGGVIVQRISAISCGAAVGESPHSEEVIYVVYRYSIYSINEISLGWWCEERG
jgi:hypothetical protein